jgi:hypothetical protein
MPHMCFSLPVTYQMYRSHLIWSMRLQGTMQKIGRSEIHDQRVLVLQPGSDDQCGGCGGHSACQREGVKHRLDGNVAQLGPELAVQHRVGRAVALIPGHSQQPANLHLLGHCPL